MIHGFPSATPTDTSTSRPTRTPTPSPTGPPTATARGTPTPPETPIPSPIPTATATPTTDPLLRDPSVYWIQCRVAVCDVLYPEIGCTSTGPIGSVSRLYSTCVAPTWSMACAPGSESFLVCANGQDGNFTCDVSFPDDALKTLDCSGPVWQGSCTLGFLYDTNQAPISCSRTDSNGTEVLDCVWTPVSQECNWKGVMSFSCVSQFVSNTTEWGCSPAQGLTSGEPQDAPGAQGIARYSFGGELNDESPPISTR